MLFTRGTEFIVNSLGPGAERRQASPSFWKRLAELSSAVLVKSELAWAHRTSSTKGFFFFNERNTFGFSKLQLAPSLALSQPLASHDLIESLEGLSLAFKTLRRFAQVLE